MQDLFMYFYQDNCDLNDVNYWWNIIKRDHVSATHLRSDSHVAVLAPEWSNDHPLAKCRRVVRLPTHDLFFIIFK